MSTFLVGLLGLAFVVIPADPAAADCSSPSVDWGPREVARGGTVHVTGSAFGDACNDVGPLPAGVRVLGQPLQDIEIVLVQGDVEVEVAEGDADADYGFEVEFVVPPELQPGLATFAVRLPEGVGWVDPTAIDGLTITDDPATGAVAAVADFSIDPAQPGADDEADDEVDVGGNSSSSRTWWIVAGAFVVVTAAGALIAARTH